METQATKTKTSIRWQFCWHYNIPVCRFCSYPFGDKIRPLYTKHGGPDLKREVLKHMKAAHPEYVVVSTGGINA